MDALKLIDKYYPEANELRRILLVHSWLVVRKALEVAGAHPELNLNRRFLVDGALLHDIGIFQTNAPVIHCQGSEHYLRHGFLGAELLRREGYPDLARVCERHTGAGLTACSIREQHLPLPERDFLPETLEEQVICFADKFFSKTKLTIEKTPEQALHSLRRFGPEGVERFQGWMDKFL